MDVNMCISMVLPYLEHIIPDYIFHLLSSLKCKFKEEFLTLFTRVSQVPRKVADKFQISNEYLLNSECVTLVLIT